MPRCPTCRTPLHGTREEIGARCSECKHPLYEYHDAQNYRPRQEGSSKCAVHEQNRAVGTCQRCGNYLCPVCWTKWQGKSICAGCLNRALDAREASPRETSIHFRQAVMGLACGIGAWFVAAVAFVIMGIGAASEGKEGMNIVLVGIGALTLMASPLPAVVGIGQAAAAIRTRGNHMIMATAGLFVSGLNMAVVIGVFSMAIMKS